MKKLLILLVFLIGCSDPEVIPEDDTFYPCDIESTPPYFNGVEPDDIDTYSNGRVVYTYNCVYIEGYEDNKSVIITWTFDTCWAYKREVDDCR